MESRGADGANSQFIAEEWGQILFAQRKTKERCQWY